MSAATLQNRSSPPVRPTEHLGVPVLLNLRTSLRLPLAPDVVDGPVAWVPCEGNLFLPASLPEIPSGETVCVIALYKQCTAEHVQGELLRGLPLTPAWLRSVLRRGEWDDAIAVGPVLSLHEAQAAGQFMFAIAAGCDDAQELARALLPEAVDVAERVARRFRAEVQVLALAGDEGKRAT